MTEPDRICPDVPDYSISATGVVKRAVQGMRSWATPGKVVTPERTKDGHLRVTLFSGGKRVRRMVHRLVCEAWHGKPTPEKPMACHRDDNKDNNTPQNLYWGTAKDNGSDSHRNGKSVRGSAINTAKLQEIQVLEIRRRAFHGETNVALALEFGVPDTAISRIVLGKNWKHVGGPIITESRKGKRGVNFAAANDNTPIDGATTAAA